MNHYQKQRVQDDGILQATDLFLELKITANLSVEIVSSCMRRGLGVEAVLASNPLVVSHNAMA